MREYYLIYSNTPCSCLYLSVNRSGNANENGNHILIPSYLTFRYEKLHVLSQKMKKIYEDKLEKWVYFWLWERLCVCVFIPNRLQLPGTNSQFLPVMLPQSFLKNIPWKGAGIAQWLEHRTRDWKVAGSNPCWSGGRIFFSRVDFVCWFLFWYLFHPPCYRSST